MFAVKGSAELTKIEVRKGTGEDATVAVELRFTMHDVPAVAVAAALGAESATDVESAFFLPSAVDVNRSSRFLNMKSIHTKASYDAKHELTIPKLLRTVRAAKVAKISVLPRGYCRFDVGFAVVIEQPPEGAVELLAEKLHREISIDLVQDPELALEGGGKARKPATQNELALDKASVEEQRTAAASALARVRSPRKSKKSVAGKRNAKKKRAA